jgi:hypothetical protein
MLLPIRAKSIGAMSRGSRLRRDVRLHPIEAAASSRGARLRGSERLQAPLHESGRRHDRDLAERIERQQVAVAGDDQVRVAVDRQLEEFIIRGIAAGGDALGDRHQLGGRQHPRHAFAQQGNRRRNYVRPAQDVQKLLLGRGGFEQAVMPVDPARHEER